MRITRAKAKKMIKEITKANPNRISACMYEHDDKPVCLVGVLLNQECGISVETLRGLDLSQDGSAGNILPHFNENEHGVSFTKKAVDYLSEVQRLQDNNVRWGDIEEKLYGNRVNGELLK